MQRQVVGDSKFEQVEKLDGNYLGTLADPTWTSVYKLRCSADRDRVVDLVILGVVRSTAN